MGYNGFPIGCSDDKVSWEREGDFADTKYPYVCHAELNAILNYTGTSLRESRVYVTLFPCNECAKVIAQSGIKEVVYLSDKYAETDSTIVSKRILDSVGIKYRKYEATNKKITIEL